MYFTLEEIYVCREIFHTTELKVSNENCILIGTSAEFVFRCSIYGKQCKKYRKNNWNDSNGKNRTHERGYLCLGISLDENYFNILMERK